MTKDIFPGMFALGMRQSHEVRVSFGFSNSGIFLSDGSQRMHANPLLHLDPFSQRMLLRPREIQKLGELSYAGERQEFRVSGTRVGEVEYGPLGHPADGEFEVRPIAKFDVAAHFASDSLNVEIAGRTEKGFYVCYFARTLEALDLEPWTFQVQISVERARIPEFLGLDQEFVERLLAQTDGGGRSAL